MSLRTVCRSAIACLLLAACAADMADPSPADPRDECATCAGKDDGWGAPAPDSCEAEAIVRVANEASFEELDDDAELNRIAASHLVAARERTPFTTLEEVDDVFFVGVHALGALLAYGRELGFVAACEAARALPVEYGLVSDLDKTVIPPEVDEGTSDAPYPGVVTLYRILELGADGAGATGDVTYVTARTPERVDCSPSGPCVPGWLAAHGLPEGPIETGISGVPWVAQSEKVRDISRVLDANPDQPFLLFGDSSHRDPEAYREVLELYPKRTVIGLIHRVTATERDATRFDDLHVYDHYPEAAAILVGLGVITEADAWRVYEAAVQCADPASPDVALCEEGLDLDEALMIALLEQHAGS